MVALGTKGCRRHLLGLTLIGALWPAVPQARELVGDLGGGTPQPRRLEVVTLNAWGLPAPIARKRPVRMQRLARFVENLRVDVVALQEVWNGAVPQLPLSLVRSDGRGDDGLALRSRHDLRDVSVLRFSKARGFDALKRKGALRARITLDGVDVWVVVTHLQAGFGRANGRVRDAQIAEILAWLEGYEEPVVLLGDLNLTDRRPEDRDALRRLEHAGFVDVADVLDRYDSTYPADGHRYDRVLVRGGRHWALAPTVIDVLAYDDDPDTPAPPFLSDHLPVRVELELVPEGDARPPDERRAHR